METKSLYTILGIRPEASPDQIETAYAALLHQLKGGNEANPAGDDRIRLIAAKEAYDVLTNPASRQLYNQKLFAPQTLGTELAAEPVRSGNLVKLLVFGAIVIAVIWAYNRNAIEKEKLRLQHEKELVENQIKLERVRMDQQEAYLQAQQQRDRVSREQAIRESRDLDYRLQQQSREQQVAEGDQMRQAQQEEARRLQAERQKKYEAERQIEREKQALRNLQNENRSSGRRYY